MTFAIDPAKHPTSFKIRSAFAQAIGIDDPDGEILPQLAEALGVPTLDDRAVRPGDYSSIAQAFADMRDREPEGSANRERLSALADLYDAQSENAADDRRLLMVSVAMAQIGTIKAKNNVGMDRLHEITSIAFEKDASAAGMSWCGIFVVWAHKVAGLEIGAWKMGYPIDVVSGVHKVDAPPAFGDIGKELTSLGHHYIVVRVNEDGKTISSVDGNTGGDDRTGGQVAALADRRTLANTVFLRGG